MTDPTVPLWEITIPCDLVDRYGKQRGNRVNVGPYYARGAAAGDAMKIVEGWLPRKFKPAPNAGWARRMEEKTP